MNDRDPLPYLSLGQCRRGHAYRVHSRNLAVGVFDGGTGFIGIREKLGARYLFREYHWDQGPPFGTVRPVADLGPVPADLVLTERLGTRDERTGRPVTFERPIALGGRGWCYADTGEADPEIAPRSVSNRALFAHLEALEADRRRSLAG